MLKPLRLGVSGSSFIYVMPREVLRAAYGPALRERPRRFDDHHNGLMTGFMRDLARVVSESRIEAMECYHSTCWDSEPIIEILRGTPNVEFWSVHAPYGRYADLSSPDPEAREGAVYAYGHGIGVAARLGAEVVVVHPGANDQYDVPKQTRIDFSVETLKAVADTAGEQGIRLAVEPLPKREAGNTLDEVLEILAKVDRPNVGINFDVNHLFPPEDIPALIRKAGDLIFSVHISDQDGEERHWLPLAGSLDWQAVLAALVEVGYKGPLIYETHIKEVTNCEEAARAVVENYERLIELAPAAPAIRG